MDHLRTSGLEHVLAECEVLATDETIGQLCEMIVGMVETLEKAGV